MSLISNYYLEIECIFRILVAAICGSFIGIERKVRLKEAGTRTHLVVAFGSALFMIVSKYGFEDMLVRAAENSAISFDPTRIASTIVTGIGFLGAGTIFVRRNVINGLTTAAGLWSTAAVGMAVGAGQYIIGISATVILVLFQWFLHSSKLFNKSANTLMTFKLAQTDKPFDKLERVLGEYGIKIKSVNFEKNSNSECKIECIVKMPSKLSHIELSDNLCAYDFILSVEF